MSERSTAGFVRTLLKLQGDRATGTLSVKAEDVTTRIHFKQGKIVFAEGGTVQGTLGRLLVDEGRITQAQYAQAIQVMTDQLVDNEQMRLGEVLVQLGFVDLDGVQDALASQIRRKVVACLQWDRLELNLKSGSPDSGGAHFPTTVEPLVLEGVHRFFAQERRDQLLRPFLHCPIGLTEDAHALATRFHLSPEEETLIRSLDGSTTLGQIIGDDGLESDTLGATEEECALLTALFLTRTLQPVLESPSPSSERAPNSAPEHESPSKPRTPETTTTHANARGLRHRPTAKTSRRDRRTESGARRETAARPSERPAADPTRDMRHTTGSSLPRRSAPTSPLTQHSPPPSPSGATSSRRLSNTSPAATSRTRSSPTFPEPSAANEGMFRAFDAQAETPHDIDDPPSFSADDPPLSTALESKTAVRKTRLSAEQAYQQGLRNLWAQHYSQAAADLQIACEAMPDAAEYQLIAAWARYQMCNDAALLQQMRVLLRRFARKAAKQDRELAFPPFVLAHLALVDGEDDKALRLFRVAALRDPSNLDAERHVRLLEARQR